MEEAKTRIMYVHVRGQRDVIFLYVFGGINHVHAGSDIKEIWKQTEGKYKENH
jgi:hypothetical protein